MDFHTDNPVFLRNLQLYPILTDKPNQTNLHSIERLLEKKEIKIAELDNPVVDQIDINNSSDYPLLVIDGEEIAGAMQNRIVAASTFIPARSQKTISVVCVEEGRWKSIGGFKTGFCSYPRLRSILLNKRSSRELQQDVWKEITQKLDSVRINSATSSMHDIYKGLEAELDRYTEDFCSLNNQAVGFIGTAGDRILGCDLFASNSTFKQFEKKLVRSYALQALEIKKTSSSRLKINEFVGSILKITGAKQNGRKNWIGFSHGDIAGQAVFDHKLLLHLSAFPA